MSAAPARSTAALGVHTLASRLVIFASGFTASVLIARGLGAAGNGLYATAMTIGTIAFMVGALGSEQAQARTWSRAVYPRSALYGSAIGVAAVAGAICGVCVLAVWVLGRESLFAGLGLGVAIVIVAASVPFRIMLTLLRGLFVVGGHIERSNVMLAIGDLARTLAIVALALAGALSVETVVGALWVAVLVPLALHARAAGPPERPPPGLVAAQLRDGLVLSPYFAFLFLNLRLDVLLLAALATTREVGVYAVAVIFAELVWLVTDAINMGARARQWSASADDALAATASAARMSLLLALLALPVLALAAPTAITLFFGAEFADARQALWVLLPAAVAMAWWRSLSAGLVRFGRVRGVHAIAFVALTANVTLNVLLIPSLGIVGAGLASLGSYVIGALLATSLLREQIGARELLPGTDDVRRLVALVRGAVRPARAGDDGG